MKVFFSFAVGVGLFGCLEAGMRLMGYEPLPDLREIHMAFATGEGPFYPSRNAAGQRIFRRNVPDDILPSFRHTAFPAQKPPGRVRMFCLGESTVYGMPFPPKTAFPAWLEDAFQTACPSADVEVIECGMPGVDSYGVMAMARLALRDWSPDILVLYTGHNDFLMANRLRLRLRAGLEGSLTSKALWLLRRSRLYLLLKKQLPLSRRMDAEADREVARLRTIKHEPTFTLAERDAALRAFRENLEAVLRDARRRDVRVLICKTVSNVRDVPPNLSYFTPGTSPEAMARIEGYLKEGEKLEKAGLWAEAVSQYEAALKVDPNVATVHFRLAGSLAALERPTEARRHYVKAMDLDGDPNRAVSELNRIVADVCDGQSAIAVDVPAAFERESPNGLVGYNLLVDHCHPSVRGHQIIAEELCNTTLQTRLLRGVSPAKPFAFTAEEIAAAHEYAGVGLLQLSTLRDTEKRLARARSELEQALNVLPSNAAAQAHLAVVSLRQGRADEAAERLNAALRLDPEIANKMPQFHEILRQAGLRMANGKLVPANAAN